MSPVIGVILMVAITVILAAVVGSFVLDLGQTSANDAPQASLSVESGVGSDTITIEHFGGDPLRGDRTRLVVTNESNGSIAEWSSADSAGTLEVGGTVEIDFSTNPDEIQSTTWTNLGSTGSSDGGDTNVGTIESGISYTVRLIDVETQRFVFETTITV